MPSEEKGSKHIWCPVPDFRAVNNQRQATTQGFARSSTHISCLHPHIHAQKQARTHAYAHAHTKEPLKKNPPNSAWR